LTSKSGANENALKNYQTAIELAKQANDIKAKLRAMIALSNYYINRNDYRSPFHKETGDFFISPGFTELFN
jgi:hypothetical protein